MWRLFRSNPLPAATVETVVEPLQPARFAADISPTDFVCVEKGLEATIKSSLSHSISQILVFTLCLNSIVYMGVLKDIRTKMTNQSAFEINGNGLFLIISICSLFVAEIASVILFSTNLPTKCYAGVKRIAMFSANFSLWSLMLVLDNAPKQKLMVYLLSFAFFGMTLTYVCSGDDDRDRELDKKSPISVFAYVGLVILPLAVVVVLCVPKNLDFMVYTLIYPTVGMEAMCVFMIFFKVMFHQGIQQDNDTNDLIAHKDQNKNDLEASKI